MQLENLRLIWEQRLIEEFHNVTSMLKLYLTRTPSHHLVLCDLRPQEGIAK